MGPNKGFSDDFWDVVSEALNDQVNSMLCYAQDKWTAEDLPFKYTFPDPEFDHRETWIMFEGSDCFRDWCRRRMEVTTPFLTTTEPTTCKCLQARTSAIHRMDGASGKRSS